MSPAETCNEVVTAPEQKKQPAMSTKRRVRVLSVESLATEQNQNLPVAQSEPESSADDGIRLEELEKSKSQSPPASGIEPEEPFPFSSISKRSSSLSPRVVPRFGVPSEDQQTPPTEKKSLVSSLFRSRPLSTITKGKEAGGIEMTGVEIREDAGTSDAAGSSLQCFVGKRKVSSQVLDI